MIVSTFVFKDPESSTDGCPEPVGYVSKDERFPVSLPTSMRDLSTTLSNMSVSNEYFQIHYCHIIPMHFQQFDKLKNGKNKISHLTCSNHYSVYIIYNMRWKDLLISFRDRTFRNRDTFRLQIPVCVPLKHYYNISLQWNPCLVKVYEGILNYSFGSNETTLIKENIGFENFGLNIPIPRAALVWSRFLFKPKTNYYIYFDILAKYLSDESVVPL